MLRGWKLASRIAIICTVFLEIAIGSDNKPAPPDYPPAQQEDHPAFVSPLYADLHRFRRIVFLIDTNTALVGSLANETEKAVDDLSGDQSFNIIYLHGTGDAMAKELVPATPENKKMGASHLESFSGGGVPHYAEIVGKALREKPDLVYLVTDSDFGCRDENDDALKKFRESKKVTDCKFYTVALMNAQNQDDRMFINLLRTFSHESHGKFRCVDSEKLE